jgi:general secretion pathway protein L
MTTTLMLLAGEHWPRDPVADWVLLDTGRRRLDSGRSEPRHWPPAQRHELVLAGSRALWLELELPPAPRREQAQLIRYALEAQLARDPDLQHATVSGRDAAAARCGVIVIERGELAALVAACNALGRPLAAVRSALQLAPPAPGAWVLAMLPGGDAVLRAGVRSGIALDAGSPAALADWLALQWNATPPAERPQVLELRCARALQGPDPAALALGDGVALRSGAELEWWQLPPDAANLLHGEFAPAHDRNVLWRRLRAPLALATSVAMVWLIAQVAMLVMDGREERMLRERGERIAAEALPGQPLLEPRMQLRRALERSLQAHGQLAAGDLLSLLDAALEAGAPRPSALRYEDGRLTLQLAAVPAAELLTRLDARGLAARAEGTTLILAARP